MAEILEPTAPPSVASYQVQELLLSRVRAFIKVVLSDSLGNRFVCSYTGGAALAKINQLNTANLTVSSLEKRILESLVSDGKLPAGTVTGTPE